MAKAHPGPFDAANQPLILRGLQPDCEQTTLTQRRIGGSVLTSLRTGAISAATGCSFSDPTPE